MRMVHKSKTDDVEWKRILGKLAGVVFEEWISDIPDDYNKVIVGIGKFFPPNDWARVFIQTVHHLKKNGIKPNESEAFIRRLQMVAPIEFNRKITSTGDAIAIFADIIRLEKEQATDNRNKRRSQG